MSQSSVCLGCPLTVVLLQASLQTEPAVHMHLLTAICANCAGGLSYYNFIRKPASDFGWDWGPAFAPAGIYGMVEIQAYSYAIMTGASMLSVLFFPWP